MFVEAPYGRRWTNTHPVVQLLELLRKCAVDFEDGPRPERRVRAVYSRRRVDRRRSNAAKKFLNIFFVHASVGKKTEPAIDSPVL